ncbi:DUF1648 domain-containing protein [Flavobacteriaceae bacterium]|nr:DUF1648 domain-containing protein [Flavobacteriaceae bacterium]
MTRPIIKISLDNTDRLLICIGVLSLIILFGLPLYYFSSLPETIPIHFDLYGNPDGFANKNNIWALPIIGSLLYAGIHQLNKYPHLFNYPIKITEKNAAKQYQKAIKLLRTLNTIIVVLLTSISSGSIQTALGNQKGLNPYVIVVGGVFILLVLLIYLVDISKKGNSQ